MQRMRYASALVFMALALAAGAAAAGYYWADVVAGGEAFDRKALVSLAAFALAPACFFLVRTDRRATRVARAQQKALKVIAPRAVVFSAIVHPPLTAFINFWLGREQPPRPPFDPEEMPVGVTFERDGVVLWSGGSEPQPLIHIGRSQIGSVGSGVLRVKYPLGTFFSAVDKYPALVLLYHGPTGAFEIKLPVTTVGGRFGAASRKQVKAIAEQAGRMLM